VIPREISEGFQKDSKGIPEPKFKKKRKKTLNPKPETHPKRETIPEPKLKKKRKKR